MLLLSISFSGCTDRDDDLNAVHIRVRNQSALNFDEVQVGDAEEVHLNVAPDSFSEYFDYETAYRTALIEVTSGAESFVLQPIDFVGETPLPDGFYTYELNITDAGELTLEFMID